MSSGSPGRSNDSQIFETSALRREIENCSLLTELKREIQGVDVPVHLIGDSAFRLSDKVMKPFPFNTSQSRAQKAFNYKLSKCRRVVENAFGHLKARFRRIGKGIDNHMKNTNVIIMAACVLHNFLNEQNDAINETWLRNLTEMESLRQYPTSTSVLIDRRNNPERIRNAMAIALGIHFLFHIYISYNYSYNYSISYLP